MNVAMSDRTKKLIKLAVKGDPYTFPVDDVEIHADSPSISNSSSDTSYIPSTGDDTNTSDSREIPILSPILLNKSNNDIYQSLNTFNDKDNFTALNFEFQNNLNHDNLSSTDIENLRETFFQKHGTIQVNITTIKPKTNSENVFESSFLIKNKYKKTFCKFCEDEITSKHFARHLQRNHSNENEVREIFSLEAKSVERKQLLQLLRNAGNLDPAIRGQIIPKKLPKFENVQESDYAICIHCKGYYKRLALSRHSNKCFAKKSEANTGHERALSASLVYSASLKKYGDVLNKLAVTTKIFNRMQADDITSTAINDILLIQFGEDLLKKSKNKRSLYHVSNKLRECGKFLLEMRKLGTYNDMLSTLRPENFDNAVEATKKMSRYDVESRSFGAASLALHFGTTLKKLAELAIKLVLRKKVCLPVSDAEKLLTELERFKKIVECQWTTELGSLALKDLNEKCAVKPKLLPVTEDIIKLKNFTEQCAEQSWESLKTNKTISAYKTLAEATLVLTILHNRKRVGDIQYLDLNCYNEQMNQNTSGTVQTEIATSLTENEKILTQHYKRIISIGKGSRPVTILIPKKIQKYFGMLFNLRTTTTWFQTGNNYFFTFPKSIRWLDGCAVIRKYAGQCGARHPQLLTSCRLRKHIATVTQILSLKDNEIEQLAKFMGHTSKTHANFYKLPQDIYQVAKISKILQLMEQGNAAQFKNKCLEEIDIDMENIEEDYHDAEAGMHDFESNGLNTNTGDLMGNSGTVAHAESSSITHVDRFTDGSIAETPHLNAAVICSNTSDTNHSESSNNDDESENVRVQTSYRPKTSKKDSRQRWKQEQKNIMLHYFKNNLRTKKALRKNECEEFIRAYKKQFEGVNWVRVKTFLFNECRKCN